MLGMTEGSDIERDHESDVRGYFIGIHPVSSTLLCGEFRGGKSEVVQQHQWWL